jgi:hypothetical protein
MGVKVLFFALDGQGEVVGRGLWIGLDRSIRINFDTPIKGIFLLQKTIA